MGEPAIPENAGDSKRRRRITGANRLKNLYALGIAQD